MKTYPSVLLVLKNSDLPNEKTIILDLPYVLEHKYGQIFAVVKIMRSWAKNYFHNWDTTETQQAVVCLKRGQIGLLHRVIIYQRKAFSMGVRNLSSKSGSRINRFRKSGKTGWLLCALNLVKCAGNIGLLYIKRKLLTSPFGICHRNPDSGLTGSVNPEKPVGF